MLRIPDSGMSLSVEKHNVDLGILTDWCEGSVLFQDATLSRSDVVDALLEGEVYREQDFAAEIVENVWGQLQLRQRWLGLGAPFRVKRRTIERVDEWRAFPAHSFCLVLALTAYSRSWAKQIAADFTTQGELFELVAEESLRLRGWTVYRTGWSKTNTTDLASVVMNVANQIGEAIGNPRRWTKATAKDAGLDLVCYLPFPDARGGKPVFLAQCASGADWPKKLTTPELKIWGKAIDFSTSPQKAFVMPFALQEDEFRITSNRVDGMLIDRYRLLSPGNAKAGWVTEPLKKRLLSWLEPRVRAMPSDES